MSYNPDPRRGFDPRIGNTQSNPYDVVTGPVAEAPAETRAAFLQKVYMTLFVGVAVAMGTGFMILQDAINTQMQGPLARLVLGSPIVVMIAYIAMAFGAGFAARVKGVNIVVYLLFTMVTGGLLSFAFIYAYAATGSYAVIWNAFGLTALVFGGLTGYVLISGKDFSFMGGMLWVGLLVLIGFSIGAMFLKIPGMQLGISVGAVLLFAMFVLYDTSNIMRRLGPNEWVAGALSLFIDFINMFIHILRILSDRR